MIPCLAYNAHAPRDEAKLVPLPFTIFLELEIIDRPATRVARQVLYKVLKVGRIRGLVDDDFGMGVVEGVEDVSILSAQLELLVGRGARICGFDARCL